MATLDCLADIVTFGLAPAFMMLKLVNFYYYGGPDSAPGAIIGPEAVSYAVIYDQFGTFLMLSSYGLAVARAIRAASERASTSPAAGLCATSSTQ